MYKDITFYCSIIIVLSFFHAANAQQGNRLEGYVKDIQNRPIDNINVQIVDLDISTVTNTLGYFSFSEIPDGNFLLIFSGVRYGTINAYSTIPGSKPLLIVLNDRIVGLKEVVVTAKPKLLGSSSTIDKSAIIHTQPTSLADVLQLVPGQLATNPNLSNAQQINLRQVPSTTDAGRVNALGTQIVLDGVPFSNNANLQTDVTILNSNPSALPPFSSVAGRGTDLRQIPADNIESIEVIRGIPSAKYGDLTSGLIIVNSRIGQFRPETRVRVNPNLVQIALFGGFANSQKKSTINVGIDYLNANDDVRDLYNSYSRIQGQTTWQKLWDDNKKFTTTTILSGFKSIDNLKQDPSDLRNQNKRYANDYNIKLSTEGKWKANKSWINNLTYIAALNLNSQTGYFQGLVTRDLFPISTAISDTTLIGVYGKSEYLNKTTVDGKPINAYVRVEGNKFIKLLGLNHKLVAGGEWRLDRNNGNGRQFDVLTPPRQNYSVGERPSTFKEIPALHQLAYYAEDRITSQIAGKNTIIQAGIRIDNVAPVSILKSKYQLNVSPRVNIASEITEDLWFRGGYGIATKAAPLNYLYPGIRYFDLVNFNYFANNPLERLTVITTKTINLNNQILKPITSKKFEFGFDFTKKEFVANVSFFNERTSNGIGINREVKPFTYARLRALSTPPNLPPVLSPIPISIDTFFAAYDTPVNNRTVINKGAEYSIDLPEIRSIRTSINITGAYIQTESYDNGRFTDAAKAYFSNTTPSRIGIYYSSSKVVTSRLNSSIRIVHRMPSLNIVMSALWQTIWIFENTSLPISSYPKAYLNRKGEIIELSENDSTQPEFADLIRSVNLVNATSLPPLHLYNIRLTKEWKRGFGFSFYANNFLNNRPLHNDLNTNGLIRRNEPLFFGAELNITL